MTTMVRTLMIMVMTEVTVVNFLAYSHDILCNNISFYCKLLYVIYVNSWSLVTWVNWMSLRMFSKAATVVQFMRCRRYNI